MKGSGELDNQLQLEEGVEAGVECRAVRMVVMQDAWWGVAVLAVMCIR